MGKTKFIIFTSAGAFLWAFVLAEIGYILGKNWGIVGVYFRKFDYLVILAAVAVIVWWGYKRLFKNRAIRES